jgi:cytochrome P450
VIATSSPAPFGLQGVAEKCASEFEEHLRAVIHERRERRSSGAPSQDVLQGLLAIQDDERARANVAGLMLAGSTALVKSLTQALQQLVRRPEKLRDAIVAAKEACDREDQNRSATGWNKLRALLLEALRFSPAFPMLVRYCTRDSVIGSGANARKVPAGSNVYVVMLAAMFDDSVEEADGFSAARPRDTYLHFGAGPHECLGKRIAVIEMVEMLRAFLALLDPAKVEQMTAGEIEYDGPAAHRLILHVRGAVR